MTKLVEILKDSPVILFKSCYMPKKGPPEIFMAVAKRIALLPLRGEVKITGYFIPSSCNYHWVLECVQG